MTSKPKTSNTNKTEQYFSTLPCQYCFPSLLQIAFSEMNVFIACQMFYKFFCINFNCGVYDCVCVFFFIRLLIVLKAIVKIFFCLFAFIF